MDTPRIIILCGLGLFLSAQQLTYRRFGLRLVAVPLAMAAGFWYFFVQGAPTLYNDMDLYLICGAVGAAIGLLGGILGSLRREPGTGALWVKGGVVYTGLFVLLLGARLAFAYLAEHGWHQQVVQFCLDHHITGQAPIEAAVMLMLVTTILARLAVLLARVASSQAATGTALRTLAHVS
jgi:hypothetical protein